jgi:hypothetical protein
MKSLLVAALVVITPISAAASTVMTFTDRDAFLAAIGSQRFGTETFSVSDQQIAPGGTTFGSGVTVGTVGPSDENRVEGEALRISVDNDPAKARNSAAATTSRIDIRLPSETTFFGLNFGSDTGSGGIGNDSGTVLLGDLDFNFDQLSPFGADPGYSGFFGLISRTAFQTISFGSANVGSFTDDDIRIDDLIYGIPVPVPVPASLPLMLVGIAAIGILCVRRRNAAA